MLKVDTYMVRITEFPDGTKRIEIPAAVFMPSSSEKVFEHPITKTITWCYDSDDEVFSLLAIADRIKTAFPVVNLELNMPYIPNARMDRVKSKQEVFTLKTFCNLINSVGFSKVRVLDPHSDVSAALINNIEITPTLARLAYDFYPQDKNFLVMYPDAGAAKKFNMFKEHIVGNKARDWSTGSIYDYCIIDNGIDVKDRNILIVDDICSYGGTFLLAAKALKAMGANEIYLHVDHCENSILNGELIKSGLLSGITTTDSIYTKQHDLIKVIKEYRT